MTDVPQPAVRCRLSTMQSNAGLRSCVLRKENAGEYGKLHGVRFCSHSDTSCGCKLRLNAAAKPKMLQNVTLRPSVASFEAGIEILVKNCPSKHFHMMLLGIGRQRSSFRERFVFETTKTSQATRQLCLTSHNDPEWRF